MGDACHPTLPYQAQGAAMAVEDGAVLAKLLGRYLYASKAGKPVSEVLKLYESLRKSRTTANVQGAVNNRHLFHMPDGPEQVHRDEELMASTYCRPSEYTWLDPQYNMDMLGFDAVKDSEIVIEKWLANI